MGKSSLALTSVCCSSSQLAGGDTYLPLATPIPTSDRNPGNYSGSLWLSSQWDDSFWSTVYKITNFKALEILLAFDHQLQ